MLRKLFVILISLSSIPAMAQICAPSNAAVGNGIGDGCSVPPNAPVLFPHIGIFQNTFTPACDQHDKCYTRLGADYGSCDSAFYEDMRNRCDSKYNKILRPVEWAACRQTAFEYYTAVQEYRRFLNTETGFQVEARNRSLWQQYYLDTDTCGTTPERTTLYAPQLITQINNAYLSSAGRLPTVYEFMATANAGDIANDRTGWNSLLYTLAAQAAGVQPPAIGYTKVVASLGTEHTLTANPIVAGVAYRWRLPNGFSTDGPTAFMWFEEPMYNATLQIKGYLKATSPSGVRNLALVEYSAHLQGWCGRRGGACD